MVFAGLSPGSVGLYQLNVVVPDKSGIGNLTVVPVNSDQVDKWNLPLTSRLRFGPVVTAVFAFLGASFRTRVALQLEILALRHQIGVLQRSVQRPKLTPADRFLWAWLSTRWSGWEARLAS